MPPDEARLRALIIGIDGGSFALIDPLIAAGRLPVLGGLLARSASAVTTCTWPAHTAPGWSSFCSAVQPGGHGIYQFFHTQDPKYGARITGSTDLGRSSVWDWLAAQGWTLGLVNIPMSDPPQPLPGYQVTWPLRRTLRFSEPPSLLGELAHAGAPFRSDLATMFRGDLGYLDEALANVTARVASTLHLVRTRPTDLVMAVLTEVDRVCHHYWHFCDPDHPGYETAPSGTAWADAIGRVYEAVDAAIGELLTLAGEDTTVVVVSDHGLGVGRHGFAVQRQLEEAGLLVTAPRRPDDRHAVASWFVDRDRAVDFSRTSVYQPVPGSFGLNVNLAGRQVAGTVAPADRDRVLAEAAAVLADIRTPDGRPAFAEVVPREVAYPGPHCARAPDLLMVPADESLIVTGDVSGPVWRPSWQTGLHRHRGMWLQASPPGPSRSARPARPDRRPGAHPPGGPRPALPGLRPRGTCHRRPRRRRGRAAATARASR